MTIASASSPSPSPLANLIDLAATASAPEAAITYALVAVFNAWSNASSGEGEGEAATDDVFARTWAELTPGVRGKLDAAVEELFESSEAEAIIAASEAFESLLANHEQNASPAGAQLISPRALNSLIGALARPGDTAFDPACGSGGTLAAIAPVVQRIYGADIDAQATEIARMRLTLKGAQDPSIEVRDSLVQEAASKFDLVVCHPPLGTNLGKSEVSASLRQHVGAPGAAVDGNAAWLWRVSEAVAPGGRGLVVVPPASLADRTQMLNVRSQILGEGRLEAIIALPHGALPKSDVAPFLWVISGQADPRKNGRVLMVTAAGESPLTSGEDVEDLVESLVRGWVDDATPPDAAGWRAVLVDGDELEVKGYAPQIHLLPPPLHQRVRPSAPGRLLTELRLHNFKSVGAPKAVPLRPLTLLYGKNSAGKSSLIQSLLLLKQSLLAGGFTASGDSVDLGSLAGLLHHHDLALPLEVGVSFGSSPVLDGDSALPDPAAWRHFDTRFTYPQAQDTGRAQQISLGLGQDRYSFLSEGADYLLPWAEFRDVTGLLGEPTTLFGQDEPLGLTQEEGVFEGLAKQSFPNVRFRADGLTVGALDPKFRRDVAYQTAGSAFHGWGKEALERCAALFQALSEETVNLAERMVYLGPLRQAPERFSHRNPVAGNFDMPFFLLENPSERAAVSDALEKLGIPYSLDVVNPIDPEYRETLGDVASLVLTDRRSGVKVTPADVGFGISQVLPIVTEISARNSSVIMIEQPEIHLHPAMQAELADLFIEAVDPSLGANQVIAETHSEVLIMRLQKRIREQVLSPADVLLLYVDQDPEGNASITEIRLDEHGDFLDHWPGGFFDEQFNEIFGDF